MSSDTKRLANDLQSVISTLCPEVDMMKLEVRLEEVLGNYENNRKTIIEAEKDISEKVDLYLSSKKLEGLSDITLNGYRMVLKKFASQFPKAVVHITTADIRTYLGRNEGLKMSTIGTKLSTLKSFFGWLVKEEVLLRDPTAKVRLPKKEKRLPKGLSIEELEKVRESCKTLRQRALIEVLYSTGCRLAELAAMNKADVNYQSMSMKVIGKGNKERIVYLSFKALYHLKKYLKSRNDEIPALFVTTRKPYRRMGHRAIQREIEKVEIASNIPKKLHPHVMRHTFGTLSMDAGIELADLQHLMGHSNPGTTLIYANVSEERKQAAFKKYHVQ
ncbi:tyrosine-type recombinase/integrase [Psychrobacillus sp. FSL K6-2684]|uniref:tyrosine-type recombinase/integrase n=1 Tax=Psychrobacillus sp. FSL K6-2684 TaxID=2921547 RepID=UPI0030FC5CD3